jgi:phage protein U
MMLAQLGSVIFELLKAPTKFEQRRNYEWAEHSIVEKTDRLQYTGRKAENIELTILFHRIFCDPETEYKALKKIADDTKPVPFILGTGEVLGNYVITLITKTTTQMLPDGHLLSIEVNLQLREYVK